MTTLLPPNATDLERALEAVIRDRIDGIAVPFRDLWSAENCPEALLPWLAWALSIDQWSPDWPIDIRRARVASAIAIQRMKGSAQSLQDLIASFGGSLAVSEWFQKEPRGVPHTFDILVTLGGQAEVPSADFIDAVIAEVSRTKPVRSHFTFTLGLQARGSVGLRAVGRVMTLASLRATAPAA